VSFAENLGGQLARPRGIAGWLLGEAMDIANRKPVKVALDLLDAKPGQHILDAGCGTGEALRRLAQRVRCEAAGIDPSQTMIAAARRKLGRNVPLACSTIEDWPESGRYDGILALNVLYFCTPDGAMISALRRMLKPGGRLVAYVSDRRAMEGWSFTGAGHHRLYDKTELTDALCDAGFAPGNVNVQVGRVARSVTGLWATATL